MTKALFSNPIKSESNPSTLNGLLWAEAKHRFSSEKVPGMFGTLVIVLPSKHEGGEVRVTHAGETKIFESSIFSDFGTSYAAW
jgi:hypothetical protein